MLLPPSLKVFSSASRSVRLNRLRSTVLLAVSALLHAGLEGASRPNIVMIIGDDIGFSDIGCYGSEIRTPNLDRLGESGLRFTQFYNMAKCNPTRSTLMTGLYLPRKHAANAIPFSNLLQDAGYYTAIAGKEHFDKWVPRKRFTGERAFEDSFTFYGGLSFFVPPGGKYQTSFKLNGKVVQVEDIEAKKKPLYKTDFITDYALGFLEKAEAQEKPFFLYLPYHSAHYPLQARPEDIAKYRGLYKKGWDTLRDERLERQKELGVVGENVELSPPSHNSSKGLDDKYRPWDTLSEAEQDALDLEMAVYAAMVDCMDQNIGRVLERLEQMGVMDNTLVLFFSDNGACPYPRNKTPDIPPGGADSYRSLSAAWANVGNTPFRYFKQYGHEGGSRTHFIAHWPEVIEPGFNTEVSHVVDLYPTFLELAGAAYPTENDGKTTPHLDGVSMVPLLKGESRAVPNLVLSGFTEKFRMVRQGDWKIVRANKRAWELYNIEKDPIELNNLARSMPEKLSEIKTSYEEWLDQ